MGIGSFLFAAYFIGIVSGAIMAPLWRLVKHRGASMFIVTDDDTMNLRVKWQRLNGANPKVRTTKGQDAMPTRLGKYAYDAGRGVSAYTIDAKTGEAYRAGPGPTDWPTARDRAIAFMDTRDKKAAMSATENGADWAKIGAIMGAVAVLMTIMILGVIYNFLKA